MLPFDYGNRCTVIDAALQDYVLPFPLVAEVKCSPSTRARKCLKVMHVEQIYSIPSCSLAFWSIAATSGKPRSLALNNR